MRQRAGMRLVGGEGARHEGTTGQLIVLPRVWAVGERKGPHPHRTHDDGKTTAMGGARRAVGSVEVEVAFYRKYTEAMLRRFAVMSMEAGRVPSLLGRELFRGNVTHYEVHGFDDVVIFCHDVETCLKRLETIDQRLIKRVAIQQYTFAEAAMALGFGLTNCKREYYAAVDRLTHLFLERKMLEPLQACQ